MPGGDTGFVDSVVKENDFENEVRAFRSSNETTRHIDRHVLGVGSYRSAETHEAACVAAVELAGRWLEARARLNDADLLISRPIVLLDDEWIEGDPDAAPPHVYLCMARNSDAFDPADYTKGAVQMKSSGQPMVDALLAAGLQLWRLESEDPDLRGCWLLELVEL